MKFMDCSVGTVDHNHKCNFSSQPCSTTSLFLEDIDWLISGALGPADAKVKCNCTCSEYEDSTG